MRRLNEVLLCVCICSLYACRTVPGDTRGAISDAAESVDHSRAELEVAQDISGSIEGTITEIGEREVQREALVAQSNQRAITDADNLETILAAIRELIEEGIRECEDGREADTNP